MLEGHNAVGLAVLVLAGTYSAFVLAASAVITVYITKNEELSFGIMACIAIPALILSSPVYQWLGSI